MENGKYAVFTQYGYVVEFYKTKKEAEDNCAWEDNYYVSEA